MAGIQPGGVQQVVQPQAGQLFQKAQLAVQRLLIDALTDIDPRWPSADYDVEQEKRRLAAS